MRTILDNNTIKELTLQRLATAGLSPLVSRVAGMPMEMSGESQTYADISLPPAMRVWAGARSPKELGEYSVTIRNTMYESSLVFPRPWLSRQQVPGLIQKKIDGLAVRSAQNWSKLVADLLVAGESTACYDGQFFWDTDHPIGDSGSTQSNDINADISTAPAATAGTTTEPSPEEAAWAMRQGAKQIRQLKDDEGEYCNEDVSSFIVVCGEGLAPYLDAAANGVVVGNGTGLVQASIRGLNFDIVSSPRLNAWTTKFALFAADVPDTAILAQEEPAEERYEMLLDDSDYAKLNNAYAHMLSVSRGVGYGSYQSTCLVTLT